MIGLLTALLAQSDAIECDVRRLLDADIEVRERAAVALREAGVRAVPLLQAALGADDPELRGRASMILDRIAADLPASVLRLRLVFVKGRAFVEVRNTAPLRVRLHRCSLGVKLAECFIPIEPAGKDEVIALGPGESAEIRASWLDALVWQDGSRTVALRPAFSFLRPVDGSAELALQGAAAGDAIDIRLPEGETVQVYSLKKASPRDVEKVLRDLLAPGPRSTSGGPLVCADERAGAVIVVADSETQLIVKEVIPALDR